MKLQAYLDRYSGLQKSILEDEKLLRLVEREDSFLLSRIGEGGIFSQSAKSVLSEAVVDSEALKKRLRHKNRLYERYTLRLKAAADLIASPTYRRFVIERYLYGFSPEIMADIRFYSERQIFRQQQTAKRELYLSLLEVMPHPRPCDRAKTYRVRPADRHRIRRYFRAPSYEESVALRERRGAVSAARGVRPTEP